MVYALTLDLQSNRLEKVLDYVSMVHDLCTVLGMDFVSTVAEVHPSLDDSVDDNCKSISNDTLSRLDKTVVTLNEDKKLRLSKVNAYILVL
jgi:Ase1/PRC1/MAP65 family protein